MSHKEALIKEINLLPDFIVKKLLDIMHYIKLGVETEYVSKTDNPFYNSEEFKDIVSDSIAEYRNGATEDMDALEK